MGIRDNIYGLFFGKCDIYELAEEVNELGISTFERVLVHSDVDCRLVFGGRENFAAHRNAAEAEHKNNASLNVRVFTSSDIHIKAGSIITVRQNGLEYRLRSTGESAVYRHHSETLAVPDDEEV